MFLQSCCGFIQEAKRSHRAQLTGRLSNRNRISRSEGKEKSSPREDGFLLRHLEAKTGTITESWYNHASEVYTLNEDFMPFKKKALQKSPSMVATGQRGAVRAAEEVLDTAPLAEPDAEVVTEDNIMLSLRVIRGQDWQWGDEDGGPGFVGLVLSFNQRNCTAQVLWEKTSQAYSHYRYGISGSKTSDLLIFKPLEHVASLGRRNSQEFFASKFQTMIVLDWDDTLFPTSYLRDEIRPNWTKPWSDQSLPPKVKDEIGSRLGHCETKVVDLLRQASCIGKVILVTLARKPWVFDSCRNFFPLVGQAISELKVPIIYAQEGAPFDYNKFGTEMESYWSSMKAKAIARECRSFYSQYDGQSWKNIISIGDSDFERVGTMLATKDYMLQNGIRSGEAVVGDHVYKVRTKTLKMVEQPSLEELNTQLGLLRAWLPCMIKLDSDFDLNLNNAADPTVLRRITATLRGDEGAAPTREGAPAKEIA